MEDHDFPPLLDAVGAEIADYTVGFAKLSRHGGVEDAIPAGSGTLVSIGPIYGILTASHVLKELPDQAHVGIVRFPGLMRPAQRQTINMRLSEKLTIGGPPFGSEGPDMGFLRLSLEDAGNLKARCSFVNLEKGCDLKQHHPKPPFFDGISGMVAEWTTDMPSEQGWTRVKAFSALYGVGLVVREHEANGFDLIDFEVDYGPDFVSPTSYGGMSGAGLWRVRGDMDESGRLSASGKTLIGVAFHQSDPLDQKRIITCHGPASIYDAMIKAVRERWI